MGQVSFWRPLSSFNIWGILWQWIFCDLERCILLPTDCTRNGPLVQISVSQHNCILHTILWQSVYAVKMSPLHETHFYQHSGYMMYGPFSYYSPRKPNFWYGLNFSALLSASTSPQGLMGDKASFVKSSYKCGLHITIYREVLGTHIHFYLSGTFSVPLYSISIFFIAAAEGLLFWRCNWASPQGAFPILMPLQPTPKVRGKSHLLYTP